MPQRGPVQARAELPEAVRQRLAQAPARRDELEAIGLTPGAIAGRTRREALVRLRRGSYALPADRSPGPGDGHALLTAILRQHPRAVVSHRSAVTLYRLPLWRSPSRPELTVPLGAARPSGCLVRERRLNPSAVGLADGLVATPLPRTLVDCALALPPEEAAVPLDAALARGLVTVQELQEALERRGDVNHRRRAAWLLGRSSPRSENAFESWSRIRLLRLGIPQPLVQPCLHLAAGLVVPDLLWQSVGVVGEADGLGKYTSPQALRDEKVRQHVLEVEGLAVVRWTYAEMTRRSDRVAQRVVQTARRQQRTGFRWPSTVTLRPDGPLPWR